MWHDALRGLGTANAVVMGLYLAAMLAVGAASGRRVRGTRDYFTAGGRLNGFVVGVSILGTYLSALTMMALPGMAFGVHDWTYVVQLPCLVITAAVITRFVLPRYRDAGVVSIYGFLEERMGLPVRLVGAVSFILFAIGRMGLVLYLPALAFSAVTGFPLPACIVVMGVVITLYTAVGGLEAVIWTDAVQVAVFVLGAALTLGFVWYRVGADAFVTVGAAAGKFRLFVPSLDYRRITTAWLVLETIFQTVRIYGSQQDIAQRYLATPSTAQANRSVWIGILAYIPLGFVFYLIGTALFVYYRVHPDPGLPPKPDTVFPYFVVTCLPPGVSGLVLAAVFAAAMSSIDSAMNSATTVCVEDFVRRFGPAERDDRHDLRFARGLTVLWGLLATAMALQFIGVGYAQIVWGKLMGIATNGMLGLLALALLPRRVDWRAALAGFAAGYACLFLAMWNGTSFLLWPVLGNSACFLAALAVNRFLPPPARPPRAARPPRS